MKKTTQLKFQNCVAPQSINAGTATVTNNIDTQNCLELTVLFVFGSLAADLTVCKLQSSADGSTNWTDITGATLTITATDDNLMSAIHVTGLIEKNRYVKAVVTGNTGADLVAVIGILSMQDQIPYDATTRGLEYFVEV